MSSENSPIKVPHLDSGWDPHAHPRRVDEGPIFRHVENVRFHDSVVQSRPWIRRLNWSLGDSVDLNTEDLNGQFPVHIFESISQDLLEQLVVVTNREIWRICVNAASNVTPTFDAGDSENIDVTAGGVVTPTSTSIAWADLGISVGQMMQIGSGDWFTIGTVANDQINLTGYDEGSQSNVAYTIRRTFRHDVLYDSQDEPPWDLPYAVVFKGNLYVAGQLTKPGEPAVLKVADVFGAAVPTASYLVAQTDPTGTTDEFPDLGSSASVTGLEVMDDGRVLVSLKDSAGIQARYYWPSPTDDTDWTTVPAGYDIITTHPGVLRDLRRYNNYVAAHFDSGVALGRATGRPDLPLAFTRTQASAGCWAPRTNVTVPTGEQMYLSRDGVVHAFNGSVSIPVSDVARDELAQFKSASIYRLAHATFDHYRNEYVLFMPQGAFGNTSGSSDELYAETLAWTIPLNPNQGSPSRWRFPTMLSAVCSAVGSEMDNHSTSLDFTDGRRRQGSFFAGMPSVDFLHASGTRATSKMVVKLVEDAGSELLEVGLVTGGDDEDVWSDVADLDGSLGQLPYVIARTRDLLPPERVMVHAERVTLWLSRTRPGDETILVRVSHDGGDRWYESTRTLGVTQGDLPYVFDNFLPLFDSTAVAGSGPGCILEVRFQPGSQLRWSALEVMLRDAGRFDAQDPFLAAQLTGLNLWIPQATGPRRWTGEGTLVDGVWGVTTFRVQNLGGITGEEFTSESPWGVEAGSGEMWLSEDDTDKLQYTGAFTLAILCNPPSDIDSYKILHDRESGSEQVALDVSSYELRVHNSSATTATLTSGQAIAAATPVVVIVVRDASGNLTCWKGSGGDLADITNGSPSLTGTVQFNQIFDADTVSTELIYPASIEGDDEAYFTGAVATLSPGDTAFVHSIPNGTTKTLFGHFETPEQDWDNAGGNIVASLRLRIPSGSWTGTYTVTLKVGWLDGVTRTQIDSVSQNGTLSADGDDTWVTITSSSALTSWPGTIESETIYFELEQTISKQTADYYPPTSDVDQGAYSLVGGESTAWETLDKSDAPWTENDAKYVRSPVLTEDEASSFTVAVANVIESSPDQYLIHARYQVSSTDMEYKVELLEGTTVRHTTNKTSHSGADTPINLSLAITKSEYESIGDLADLRLRHTMTGGAAGSPTTYELGAVVFTYQVVAIGSTPLRDDSDSTYYVTNYTPHPTSSSGGNYAVVSAEIAIGGTTPSAGDTVAFRFRHGVLVGSCRVQLRIINGSGTNVKTVNLYGVSGGPANTTLTLSGSEIAAVEDWSDLGMQWAIKVSGTTLTHTAAIYEMDCAVTIAGTQGRVYSTAVRAPLDAGIDFSLASLEADLTGAVVPGETLRLGEIMGWDEDHSGSVAHIYEELRKLGGI